jgi:hypothetical protein
LKIGTKVNARNTTAFIVLRLAIRYSHMTDTAPSGEFDGLRFIGEITTRWVSVEFCVKNVMGMAARCQD